MFVWAFLLQVFLQEECFKPYEMKHVQIYVYKI